MIKILYLITRLDRGGSAEAVMQWAAAFRQNGYSVKLCSGRTGEPQEDLEKYSLRTGVPLVILNSLHREVEPLNDFKALIALIKIIRREKPDIVHTNSSKAGLLGRFAARWNKVPVIVHSPHGHIFYGYYRGLKNRIFIWLEKLAAGLCDKITTLTELGKRDHLAFGIATEGKFVVIHPGVEVEKFRHPAKTSAQMRKELGIPADAFLIGWVGRFAEIKNPLLFIEAAAELQSDEKIRFIMVGDGPLRKKCENLVRDKGMKEKFTFTGHRTDIANLLSVLNIYILTSDNEGFGRSIVEAQAAGIPVIASEVGGVPEIIEDNVTGILFPGGDAEALIDAVHRLKSDQKLHHQIVKNASVRLSGFTLSKTVADLQELYTDLLSRKSGKN